MKRVVLVRHAKAVAYGYENDFHRDLRERGVIDAQLVSKELKSRGVFPDKIISSSALRALKTARIFAETFNFEETNIRKNDKIYEGVTITQFLEIIHTLPKEAKTVFFFGHNPDFHYFADKLLTRYTDEMPTCAAVVIEFDVNQWEAIEQKTGILAFRLVPKKLR